MYRSNPKLDTDRRQDDSCVGSPQQDVHVCHTAWIGSMKCNSCTGNDPPGITCLINDGTDRI